jgi:uncharacterized OB-fold protein
MTTQPRRPIPPVDLDVQPFWEGVQRHEFLLQRCRNCGSIVYHPRKYCGNCWSDNSEWIQASGKGTVYSFTVIHQAGHPFFQDKVPYVVALVDLDEGVHVMSNLVDVDPAHVYVGMPVEVTYEDVTDDFSVYLFRPRSQG